MTGTSTRPEPATPKNDVSSRALLWLTTATRSPTPMPSSSSLAACRRGEGAHLGVRQVAQRRGGLVGLVDDAGPVAVDLHGAVDEVGDAERDVHADPNPE